MGFLPIQLAPPPRSASTASHRNQLPSSGSLAGGGSYSDRLLVLKGQNVLNVVFAGRAAKNERIKARAFSHVGLTPAFMETVTAEGIRLG